MSAERVPRLVPALFDNREAREKLANRIWKVDRNGRSDPVLMKLMEYAFGKPVQVVEQVQTTSAGSPGRSWKPLSVSRSASSSLQLPGPPLRSLPSALEATGRRIEELDAEEKGMPSSEHTRSIGTRP